MMNDKKTNTEKILFEVYYCLKNQNNFLITTHVNPDGDAIVSILVFAFLLKNIGKNYRLMISDNVPAKFDFLPGIEEIESIGEKQMDMQPDVLVVIDAADMDRLGETGKYITSETVVINIDHHKSNPGYGTLNLLDHSASSTAEIVYDLILWCGLPVTKDIATLVYAGIMCDTGRFLFPNTTFRSLSICSEMVKKGAIPDQIAENIYFRSSQKTIQALALAFSTLEFHFDGKVSSIYLPYNKSIVNGEIDTEGFVDHLLTIDGTEVEFFMHEKKPDVFKISLRSKNYVDVNRVANELGGGGHVKASGCTLEGNVKTVRKKILNILKKYVK